MNSVNLQTDGTKQLNQFDAGILPKQKLEEAISLGLLKSDDEFAQGQVQPASVDLRLGSVAYRIRAGFLPGEKSSVKDKLNDFTLHQLDLRDGAVLEVGCVYLVELKESLQLPAEISGRCNPKSTTGRLDVFARVLSDYGTAFDEIKAGYCGGLFMEITPRTFPILARQNDTLGQLRLKCNQAADSETRVQVVSIGLRSVETPHANKNKTEGAVGYRAKKYSGIIDLRKINHYRASDYWEEVKADSKGRIVLEPDDFYIFASRERIMIPRQEAAEMLPTDAGIGEFRAHYAGFFDPGFGDVSGARAVLEVRGRDLPFILEDGQPVAKLIYESISSVPSALYGDESKSNYFSSTQTQNLRLAKQFAMGSGSKK